MENSIELLKEKLIKYGGIELQIPEYEDVLDDLLEYGEFWNKNDTKINLSLMRSNECHSNSAEYWMNYIYSQINKEDLKDELFSISDYLDSHYNEADIFIVTGYALSGSSNKWYQHSFLIDKRNSKEEIIETTPVNWISYYGVVLNSLDCLEFYDKNI